MTNTSQAHIKTTF